MVDTYLERVLNNVEVAGALQQVLDAHYGPGAAELEDILGTGSRSLMITGSFHGQPAVFKKSASPSAHDVAKRVPALIEQYETVLHAPCAVHPVLGTLPDHDLVIYGFVKGDNLLGLFKTAPEETRLQLVAKVEEWLRQTAALGQSIDRFNPTWLLKKLRRQIEENIAEEDRPLRWRLLELLEHFAKQHHGHPMRKSHGHNDCHPGNFIWDGTTLCAVDLELLDPKPTCKMLGSFLAMKRLTNSGSLRFGARRPDFDLLARSTLLEPGEAKVTLPFYTAACTLEGTSEHPARPSREKLQRERIRNAINCLTSLGKPQE